MATAFIFNYGVGTVPGIAPPANLSVYADTADTRLKTIDNGGTVRVLVDRGSAETLSAKKIDSSCTDVDAADATKVLAWSQSGMTTGVTLTLSTAQSTSQTLSLPNITGADTVMTLALAQAVTGVKTMTNMTAAAGTTGVPSITLLSGTLMTTSAAGCFEYDGVVGYFSYAASGRGVNVAHQHITLTAAYTLASQTAAQKLFNAPANGQVTLAANTTYYFECEFSLSAMSGSAGTFGFALGGTATLTRQEWQALASKSALATATAPLLSHNTAANVAISESNTTTTGKARVTGKIVVAAGGTLIPQVSLGVAAAAAVGVDSWFRVWPAGANTVQSVGNWS